MADLYATITDADEAVQRRIADVLELRAADPQQHAMLEAYLEDVPLGPGARVLEIGCGTGAIARVLAARAGVGEVVGIDPFANVHRARSPRRRPPRPSDIHLRRRPSAAVRGRRVRCGRVPHVALSHPSSRARPR